MPEQKIKCVKCGSANIARYLWGMPAWSEKLEQDIEAGRITLGGCCVSDKDPDYQCNDCGHEWAKEHNTVDNDWDDF